MALNLEFLKVGDIVYFQYGEKEIKYLSERDSKLKEAIERIGMIKREVNPDVFSAVVFTIIGQQISMAAQRTICNRLIEKVGDVQSDTILALSDEQLKSVGISFRKASYIKNFAQHVQDGSFDLEALQHMSDEDVVQALSSLKGIGEWTAQMLMIFSLERQNVLSFGDLAIVRGMKNLYQLEEITKDFFEQKQAVYSPYGTVASFYLWELAVE